MYSHGFLRIFDTKPKKPPLYILLDHFLALILPLIGLLLVFVLGPLINNAPMLIFIPLIALSAWIGGMSPGILTSLISAIIINYYFVYPLRFSLLPHPQNLFYFVLLIIEGLLLCFLIGIVKNRERIAEYKRRERELTKRIEELEEKNRSLEKEIRSRDEFLSIASHELKTPLTSMLLQTQTALHNIRNVSVARFSFENLLKMLESVENQTKRLSKMINDLLAVSVITVGNLQLEYEEIELDNLVKGVLTDFAARIEREKVQVNYAPKEKIVGQWDKIRVEQAVSNFVSNAIKYGEQKPIDVKIKRSKNFAELAIIDHGIGIPKQKQQKIFELFHRAVPTEKYKGLGVGLYITQKIISAHGGSVYVSSSPDKGSAFTMKLPLKKPTKSN